MRTLFLFLAFLNLALVAPADAAGRRFVVCSYGKPASACVRDGDTIWFGGEKIRLVGIDAPEMGKPRCSWPAATAKASRDALVVLLNSGTVTLERHGQDVYDRILARVLVNGADVGKALMAQGLARPYVSG